jgi:hypothetical protein
MMTTGQPAAAPGATPAPDASQAQGTTVCISAQPDGSFQVYLDNDEGEQDQPGQAPDDESAEQASGQSAPDIDSALKIAKQMLSGGSAGSGQDDAEALFQGGFAGAKTPLGK